MLVTLLFLFLCLLSSASLSSEYEQQYALGDTGPTGGVVTAVTVDTTLNGTATEIVGDFEETTQTWQHIETVVERFESTTTQTTIESIESVVVTQETTDNVICLECNVYGETTGHVQYSENEYRAVFGYQGGTITGTVDLNDHLTQQQINNGFVANSTIDAMTCLNTIGSNISCSDVGNPTADTVNITITVTDGLETYRNTTAHTIDWDPSNFRTLSGVLDVPANNLSLSSTASIEFYGIDNGYWGGLYGPTIQNPTLTFDYTVTQWVTQQIQTQIEQTIVDYVTTELTSYSEVVDSVYIPPVLEIVNIQIEPITETSFEVEVVQMDDFGVEEVEVFELEMEVEVEETVQESSENVDERVEVADKPTDKEPASKVEVQKDTSSKKPSSYNVALDSVKVALMVQNAATSGFTTYRKQTIPDVPFYSSTALAGGETVDNPMGRWMTGASEVLMEEMVESQWQK